MSNCKCDKSPTFVLFGYRALGMRFLAYEASHAEIVVSLVMCMS